jgi:hypothetical protein
MGLKGDADRSVKRNVASALSGMDTFSVSSSDCEIVKASTTRHSGFSTTGESYLIRLPQLAQAKNANMETSLCIVVG